MHCPSCGSEAPVTQKYCRSCGFNLEKIPQLVAEQLPEATDIAELGLQDKLQKRQQKIERSLSVATLSFAAISALSLLVGLLYLLAVGSIPLVPGIVVLILLITGIVAGSIGIYSERLKKNLSTRDSQKALRQAEADLSLKHYERPLSSVTERTTNLLNGNDRAETVRKLGKEGET